MENDLILTLIFREEIIGKKGGDENSGQKAPRIESFTCLSQMNDLLEPWRTDDLYFFQENKNPINIEIESRLDNGAPPIRGPCGASYRVSENYALSSGHQPFVVEIRVASKGLTNKDNQVKCLGTIITHRHILSVATCFCNRDMPEHNLDWSSVGGCESDGVKTKRLSIRKFVEITTCNSHRLEPYFQLLQIPITQKKSKKQIENWTTLKVKF